MTTTTAKAAWILHGCPKCNGDLFRDDHSYQCLQCGLINWDFQPLKYVSSHRFNKREVNNDGELARRTEGRHHERR